MTPTLSQPLINRLVPVRNNALRVTVQITVGVLIMALLSQVRLELGPVPLTGQTLGVLLIGAAYGFSLGGLTMLAYLVVGGLGSRRLFGAARRAGRSSQEPRRAICWAFRWRRRWWVFSRSGASTGA